MKNKVTKKPKPKPKAQAQKRTMVVKLKDSQKMPLLTAIINSQRAYLQQIALESGINPDTSQMQVEVAIIGEPLPGQEDVETDQELEDDVSDPKPSAAASEELEDAENEK